MFGHEDMMRDDLHDRKKRDKEPPDGKGKQTMAPQEDHRDDK